MIDIYLNAFDRDPSDPRHQILPLATFGNHPIFHLVLDTLLSLSEIRSIHILVEQSFYDSLEIEIRRWYESDFSVGRIIYHAKTFDDNDDEDDEDASLFSPDHTHRLFMSFAETCYRLQVSDTEDRGCMMVPVLLFHFRMPLFTSSTISTSLSHMNLLSPSSFSPNIIVWTSKMIVHEEFSSVSGAVVASSLLQPSLFPLRYSSPFSSKQLLRNNNNNDHKSDIEPVAENRHKNNNDNNDIFCLLDVYFIPPAFSRSPSLSSSSSFLEHLRWNLSADSSSSSSSPCSLPFLFHVLPFYIAHRECQSIRSVGSKQYIEHLWVQEKNSMFIFKCYQVLRQNETLEARLSQLEKIQKDPIKKRKES